MKWTLEDKAELFRLHKKGCDAFEIGDRMDVPAHIVSQKLREFNGISLVREKRKSGGGSDARKAKSVAIIKAIDNPVREPYVYGDGGGFCSSFEYGVPKGLSGIINGDFDWE